MRGPNNWAVTIPVVRGRALLDYTDDTCEVTYAVAIDERFSFKTTTGTAQAIRLNTRNFPTPRRVAWRSSLPK